MALRSDELANQAEVDRDQQLRNNVKKGVSTAIGLGTAAIGGGIASKVLPLLNEYVPAALALKGINKISPKLGGFLQKGMDQGLDLKEGLDYLRDQFGGSKELAKEEELPPKEKAAKLIKKHSPNLLNFIEGRLKKGYDIDKAIEEAKEYGYDRSINFLEQDEGLSFPVVLKQALGLESKQQPQQDQPQQQAGGQQRLMSILQKLQQSRGGQ